MKKTNLDAASSVGEADELLRIDPDCRQITKMGKSFLHQEIAAGRLKAYRFGRCVRVKRSDLTAWQVEHGIARADPQATALPAAPTVVEMKPTLRDQFAMAALTSIASQQAIIQSSGEWGWEDDARLAYLYADAMMAARKKDGDK